MLDFRNNLFLPKVEHVNFVIFSCYEFIVFCLTIHQEPAPAPAKKVGSGAPPASQLWKNVSTNYSKE